MKQWFTNLLSRPASPPPVDPEMLLAAQREVQSLKMDLEQRDQRIRALENELERVHAGQQALVEDTITSRMEALFKDMSGPASQLLTQADLVENQGKPVDPRDVLAVARRVIRALERNGVTFEGKIGDNVAFDPNLHTPISAASQPRPGQPARVRFVGASYKGKMIYKSVVE